MSYVERETIVLVPAELIRSNKGIGIDIGMSGAKFVYSVKEDVEDADSDDSATVTVGKLRMVTLKREELMEGLRFIKQRAYHLGNKTAEDLATINVTGLGCSQMERALCGQLNVRFRIRSETDGLVAAFCYMASKLPRKFFVESPDEEVVTEAISYSVILSDMMAKLSEHGESQTAANTNQQQLHESLRRSTGYAPKGVANGMEDTPLIESEAEFYPLLLTTCGSITASLKVTGTDVHSNVDFSPSGGRTLLGIANKLIGVKTYDEFVTLASMGDSFKVHGTYADIVFSDNADERDNIYKDFEDSKGSANVELSSFGKLVGGNSGEFKKEDIASAWLDRFVQDFVRNVKLACYLNGVNRVFICGGVLAHPYVRRLIAKEMMKKNVLDFLRCQAEPVEFYLIKVPQHLTALGSLVLDNQTQTEAARV